MAQDDAQQLKSKLSIKLIRQAFSWYFVITIILTSYQLTVEYRNSRDVFFNEIKNYKNTFGLALSQAVWEFNSPQMTKIIEGIRANNVIKGVKIIDTELEAVAESGLVYQVKSQTSKELEADHEVHIENHGESPLAEVYVFSFPIKYNDNNGLVRHLGFIYLFSDQTVILARIKESFIVILINSLLKTFALWLIFFLVSQWLIINPIQKLSFEVSQLNRDDGDPAALSKSLHDRDDEIGFLAKTFRFIFAALNTKILTIRELNQNLEHKVQTRTRELSIKTRDMEALFNAIPIGVISLGPNGLINSDHSPMALEVLGRQKIRGLNIREVLLEPSDLNAEQQERVISVINACIAEEDLNFDLNSSKLPSQLLFKVGKTARTKTLELSWSYILDEGYKIRALLLCIKDNTQLRNLEKVTKSHSQELAIISEILSLPPQVGLHDIKAFGDFLTEAWTLQNSTKSMSTTEWLRLLHMIKGLARSLNFHSLALLIHRFEEDEQSEPLKGRMIEKLAEIDELYKSYLRYSYTFRPAQDGADSLQSISIEELFRFEEGQLNHLAKISGRPSPRFLYTLPEAQVKLSKKIVWDSVFGHLFQNSLSHGIEDAKDRLLNGKETQGTISIKSLIQPDGSLLLEYTDDGRGLNLRAIKESLREQWQYTYASVEVMPLKELIQTIFLRGLSTAAKVSSQAGRGLGMDTIRYYLEREGGKIEVLIDEEKGAGGNFFPIKFQLKFGPGFFTAPLKSTVKTTS